MTLLVSLYMGRKPDMFFTLSKLIDSRLFSLKIFGITFAVQLCTREPGQAEQKPRIVRSVSSCPSVPAASCCSAPCNREACKGGTGTPQKETQSAEADPIDTCNSNRTTPEQGTGSTTEPPESTDDVSEGTSTLPQAKD